MLNSRQSIRRLASPAMRVKASPSEASLETTSSIWCTLLSSSAAMASSRMRWNRREAKPSATATTHHPACATLTIVRTTRNVAATAAPKVTTS